MIIVLKFHTDRSTRTIDIVQKPVSTDGRRRQR